MEPTTSGRFRVLESPRDGAELVFVDVETYEPTYVSTPERGAPADANGGQGGPDARAQRAADGELAAFVRGLRPGYVVDATLGWDGGTARVRRATLVGRSLVSVVDGVTGLFEVARETCRAAAAAGEPIDSTVTYDTAGDANGALYAFADRGAGDTFDAFRRGDVPLEPLLQRAERGREEEANETFLMRPVDEPFVIVYIAFRKGGVLADTVRDTYDCPRPDEPLVGDSSSEVPVERGADPDAGESDTGSTAGAESNDAGDDEGGDTDDGGANADGEADADPWDDAWLSEESDPWRD